jgi:hypothetical protein
VYFAEGLGPPACSLEQCCSLLLIQHQSECCRKRETPQQFSYLRRQWFVCVMNINQLHTAEMILTSLQSLSQSRNSTRFMDPESLLSVYKSPSVGIIPSQNCIKNILQSTSSSFKLSVPFRFINTCVVIFTAVLSHGDRFMH